MSRKPPEAFTNLETSSCQKLTSCVRLTQPPCAFQCVCYESLKHFRRCLLPAAQAYQCCVCYTADVWFLLMASTPNFLQEAKQTVFVQVGGTGERSIQIAGEMGQWVINLSRCREGVNTIPETHALGLAGVRFTAVLED